MPSTVIIMAPKAHDTHGFTLIELLVAISLVLVLAGGIIVNYNRYSDRQRVRQAALTLKNNLRLVQTKALSAEKPGAPSVCSELLGYEVSFTATSYSWQPRCDEGLTGTTQSVSLATALSFSPTPSALLFRVLTRGLVMDSPTMITITGASVSYRIQVSPSGDIADVGFQ